MNAPELNACTLSELEEGLRCALVNNHSEDIGRIMAELNHRAVEAYRQQVQRIKDGMCGGLPYPWCPQPEVCRGRSSCPRDPNCGD